MVGAMVAGVLTVAAAGASHGAPRGAPAEPTAKGTALVTRFFDQLESGDTAKLERLLSPAFQLQGADGGYLDKEEFLADPPSVESFEISNVQATRVGKVIVVRYDVEAVVTIDGVPQERAPAPRLSVFVQGKQGWQLVAHANFNVPVEEPQQ
jgi:Domain of unknown function (DUF4440)